MKLNEVNVRKMLNKESEDTIKKYVLDYILSRFDEYDNPVNIFTDVLDYGCQSGIVGSLCYYSDTVAFYNKYKDEINELLYEMFSECGTYNPKDLFGAKWDDEDPLALDDFNQNLLAWFGFEETLRNIGYEFEDVEDEI